MTSVADNRNEISRINTNQDDSAHEETDILELEPTTDLIDAAPPEDLSDEEIFDNKNKLIKANILPENTSAGRLQARVPDAPDNLIDLIYRKKCVECNSILNTISAGLMHYNSTKHQTKLAFLFLPHGMYNLPLSKEEIREVETGIVKTGEPNSIAVNRARNIPFRDLVKKFEINEDIRKLDLEFCRLCEMPFSSRVAALQHYSGKKHKKNAENWSPYNPATPVDTKDDLRCDACNVIVGNSLNMETHIAGRRHHLNMKAYLVRMNAGAIAPPMSSRGFCDFNNVEREEANPVDPSRFEEPQEFAVPAAPPSQINMPTAAAPSMHIPEQAPMNHYHQFIPDNPTGSFLSSRYEEVPSDFSSGSYAEYEPYMRSGHHPSHPQTFGIGAASFSSVGMTDPDYYNNPEELYVSGGGAWGTDNKAAISRAGLAAPYAPSFSRPVGRFPVNNAQFGPTKFKYNRNV